MSAPATSVDLRRVRPRSRFRADIEGLRAVAVLWVVAFHAGLPFVPGGFTGVDIFFVISGFLITGILLHEAESGGRVAIADFYARRVRRILPATVAMVVGVALLAQVTLSPLRQADTGLDIVFTGLFVVNWHFAAQAVDYLGSQADPSALQHMWSLSVEEQFYAVLPWLVAALALLAHRRRFPVRPVMGAAVTVVLVASFAWCVHQTAEAPGLAYFSSLTRAWELGLGAALAVIAPWLQRLPRIAAALLGWAGIVLVVLAGVRIDTDTPFPGTAALLPTLGAAALIAAGTALPHAGASRLLAVRPLPRIGGVSYGWYLWHWPLLVLASEWHGAALPVAVGIAIVAVAYLLAELSARFVEQPVRRSTWLASRTPATLALGAACTASVLLVGVALQGRADAGPAPQAAPGAAALLPGATPGTKHHRGATESPPAPRPSLQTSAQAVTPNPRAARDDLAALYSNGCHRSFTSVSADGCEFGDLSSRTTVFLIGDSHAAMWFPALEKIATARHWRLVAITKSGCPAADIEPYNQTIGRAYTECPTWRANVLARIAKERPALVFTTSINGYAIAADGQRVTGRPAYDAMTDGWVRTVTTLLRSTRVALLLDTPDMGQDVASCVSANLSELQRCAVPIARAVPRRQSDALAATRLGTRPGLTVLDVNDLMCPDGRCAAVIGNVLVYRDKDHVTATFATSMAPVLTPLLVPLLR